MGVSVCACTLTSFRWAGGREWKAGGKRRLLWFLGVPGLAVRQQRARWRWHLFS